ncbi:carboxyltransferase domain-containing protein [Brachybacterium sp. J153]|uniref:5-oxoprolinase subunit B/C family protein n=1 Tax=Brachybacterium sp. J153 TaxID=3116488 RepID=UPI002E788EBF|nr:carboxyltransferase domain-containing protein [Brachybacterium sp. J153]MEE1617666.1 carboxyltransferase domain-containing protein [Brachybacterium sp. J153]
MKSSPEGTLETRYLPAPLRVHRAGEAALLAEYPDTAAVLAAVAACRRLDPPLLRDLVPAERTVLLTGDAARDLPALEALLRHLPVARPDETAGDVVEVGAVYDGEDLPEVAELLGLSPEAVVDAHSATEWVAAFGGFAPGFAYLLPTADRQSTADVGPTADHQQTADAARPDPVGPPWEVPRRTEPRTAVPAGAIGLASRYCGIYPRSSPGGWQLIGRTETVLFDAGRTPPALLAPGTRVRFVPQRSRLLAGGALAGGVLVGGVLGSAGERAVSGATGVGEQVAETVAETVHAAGAVADQLTDSLIRSRAGQALARARQEASAVPARIRHRTPGTGASGTGRSGQRPAAIPRPLLQVLDAGPLTLLQDLGRPHRAAIGVSPSGAFDRAALAGANLAVGNPPQAAALEMLVGPLRLRALAPVTLAISGAAAPLVLAHRRQAVRGESLAAADSRERAVALEAGDEIEIGPVLSGLRVTVAVRGGLGGVRRADGAATGAVLGSLAADTLSGLGPGALDPGDVLLIDTDHGLDAVPRGATASAGAGDAASEALTIPLRLGPRDRLLGAEAVRALLENPWRVRADSNRVGVRLDGTPLPLPDGIGALPSEAMMLGAVQVPPSGLPVVFGPDHPTTGGYPVIGVADRRGLDVLAQAVPGTPLRFTALR